MFATKVYLGNKKNEKKNYQVNCFSKCRIPSVLQYDRLNYSLRSESIHIIRRKLNLVYKFNVINIILKNSVLFTESLCLFS